VAHPGDQLTARSFQRALPLARLGERGGGALQLGLQAAGVAGERSCPAGGQLADRELGQALRDGAVLPGDPAGREGRPGEAM